MRRLGAAAAVALLVLAGAAHAQWTTETVGSGVGPIQSIAVGDGDNDGSAEVYAASDDGGVYRFARVGDAWNRTTVGRGGDQMEAVVVGDGDNDGLTEVYAGGDDGNAYRYHFSGGAWVATNLGLVGGGVEDLAIGDGDNDGDAEVYAAGDNGRVYALEFAAGAWTLADLGLADATGVEAIAVGDADGDGLNEVYAATESGDVVRFGKGATGWFTASVGSVLGKWGDIAVGDADGDGVNEVYAGHDDTGRLYRYSWTGAAWSGQTIASFADDLNGVVIGDGDGDGATEAYVAADDGRAYRVAFAAGAWTTLDVGGGAGELDAIAIGDADGDGHPAVYAATSLGAVLEFATCLDLAPPVTTATLVGPAIDDAWFSDTVVVHLKATDDCGVAQTRFRLDGGPLTTYVGPIPVTASGAHEVVYHSVDKKGRVEDARVVTFGIDRAPVTTATLDGAAGDNGWFLGPVTVTLTATDDVSGVAATRVSVDGGPWRHYTEPFVLEAEGAHDVRFFSVDARNTTERTRAVAADVDLAAPTVTLERPAHDVVYVNDQEFASPVLLPAPVVIGTITLGSTADDSGSGVASVTFLVDGDVACVAHAENRTCAWDATTTTPGTHVLKAVARDFAGREAETAEMRVLVV